MAEREVAERLRAYLLPYLRDDEIDYVETFYRDGDIESLTEIAEAVSAEHDRTLAEALEEA